MLQSDLMSTQNQTLPPAHIRVMVSLFVPLLLALIFGNLLGSRFGFTADGLFGPSNFLGAVGLSSWFIGQGWYGIKGMGIRGGRPLFASAGFAFLGWVGLLVFRFYFIESEADIGSGISVDFLYLLLFEAFAMQLWIFGVFFRGVADWRGPLSAAISSGLVFGATAGFVFLESNYQGETSYTALLYFFAWGIFYGLVRLRTGSFVGMAIVQAMQSLTAWHILLPLLPPTVPQTYNNMYIGMGIVYMILVWRLWPNEEGDYRV